MSPTALLAAGFDNNQSAYFQGMSNAGLAAGGSSVSSIFFNPAAGAFAGTGLTYESSYSLIMPRTELTVTNPEQQLPPSGTSEVDIGRDALTLASYSTRRLNDDWVLGLSLSAPFGLGQEPDDSNWAGKYHGLSSKFITFNATPSVSYQLSPKIALGVGMQVEYLRIVNIKSASPLGLSTLKQDEFGTDNFGVGFTAGINFSPTPGTSIGLGYRSSVHHDIEGDINLRFNSDAALLGLTGKAKAPVKAEIEFPEKITFGIRQELSPTSRLFGTVMWTDYTSLDSVSVVAKRPLDGLAPAGAPIANFDFGWHESWSFALGGEYDLSPSVTLRSGVAYELSPIRNATERLIQLPDSDRWWVSAGASYKWNEKLSLDIAYNHMFYDDVPFDRTPTSTLLPPVHLVGEADVNLDIVVVGLRWKFGGSPMQLKSLK
jgi:long-chain fatty acid transport protein